MTMPLSADAFWQFSCALYAKPGVQSALLDLQNQHGKNINLILLLRYLEYLHFQITKFQLTEFVDCVSETDRELLHPQRAIRMSLKRNYNAHPDYEFIKQQLLDSELALEKLQQQALIELTRKMILERKLMPNNVALYADCIQVFIN